MTDRKNDRITSALLAKIITIVTLQRGNFVIGNKHGAGCHWGYIENWLIDVIDFRVGDSAFYCTLNTHYRIISYRIVLLWTSVRLPPQPPPLVQSCWIRDGGVTTTKPGSATSSSVSTRADVSRRQTVVSSRGWRAHWGRVWWAERLQTAAVRSPTTTPTTPIHSLRPSPA